MFACARTSSGIPAFVDRLRQIGELGRTALAFAELLLDLPHLLAQHVLALPLVHRRLRLGLDFARELQHLDPVREQLEHAVDPRRGMDDLEHRLLLGRLEIHEARDHVGELARRGEALHRLHELGRRLRQQLERFDRALAELVQARFHLAALLVRGRQPLDPRDEERIAVEQLEHAEPSFALRNDVVRAVGRGDVPHDLRDRADVVEVRAFRRLDVGLALQHEPDRALGLDGGLRGRDRGLAPDRHRQDHAREEHEIPDRDDDQRVVGNDDDRLAQLHRSRAGCLRRVGFVRPRIVAIEVHHGPCRRQAIFRRPITRWPWSSSRVIRS